MQILKRNKRNVKV